MSRQTQAHLALIIAGLMFGANYWVAKGLMPPLTPVQIVMFRITVTTILLWIIGLFLTKEKKMPGKDLLLIGFAGVLGVSANQTLFFEGLQYSTPVETSIIHVLSPLMVSLFAVIIIKERISKQKFVGILFGLAGAVILVSSGKHLSFSDLHLKGNLMIISNILLYSLYLVVIKPVMARYSAVHVLKYVFLSGLITFIPYALLNYEIPIIPVVGKETWIALGYVVIGTTLITYLLTIFAIRYLPSTTVGFYIYMQPFIATAIGYSTGLEKLSTAKWIAAAFLCVGVYLVLRQKNHVLSNPTE